MAYLRADTLEWLDYGLMAAGWMILVVWAVRWRWRGRRDPLRGSPIRLNRLTLAVVLACFAMNMAGGLIGQGLADWVVPGRLPELIREAWQGRLSANLMQLFVAGACLAAGWMTFDTGWRGLGIGRRPIRRDLIDAFCGLLTAICLCGAVLQGVGWVIETFFEGFVPPSHHVFEVLELPQAGPWLKLMTFGGALVLAPLGEELFFRGIIQTGLKKIMPPHWGSMRHRWAAIGLTATLFGLMHLSMPQHVPSLIVLGIVLGYLYERSGSIALPILVHMLFNGKSLLWYALMRD